MINIVLMKTKKKTLFISAQMKNDMNNVDSAFP